MEDLVICIADCKLCGLVPRSLQKIYIGLESITPYLFFLLRNGDSKNLYERIASRAVMVNERMAKAKGSFGINLILTIMKEAKPLPNK